MTEVFKEAEFKEDFDEGEDVGVVRICLDDPYVRANSFFLVEPEDLRLLEKAAMKGTYLGELAGKHSSVTMADCSIDITTHPDVIAAFRVLQQHGMEAGFGPVDMEWIRDCYDSDPLEDDEEEGVEYADESDGD